MKYVKPQIVLLPNAVKSVSANPLMKRPGPPDAPNSILSGTAAYSSDE